MAAKRGRGGQRERRTDLEFSLIEPSSWPSSSSDEDWLNSHSRRLQRQLERESLARVARERLAGAAPPNSPVPPQVPLSQRPDPYPSLTNPGDPTRQAGSHLDSPSPLSRQQIQAAEQHAIHHRRRSNGPFAGIRASSLAAIVPGNAYDQTRRMQRMVSLSVPKIPVRYQGTTSAPTDNQVQYARQRHEHESLDPGMDALRQSVTLGEAAQGRSPDLHSSATPNPLPGPDDRSGRLSAGSSGVSNDGGPASTRRRAQPTFPEWTGHCDDHSVSCTFPGCFDRKTGSRQKFPNVGLLNKHQRGHQRNYPCDECDKAFSFAHLLRRHQYSSHQGGLYWCQEEDCGHSEPWFANLIGRHYPAFHSDVGKKDRPSQEDAMNAPKGRAVAAPQSPRYLGGRTSGTNNLLGLPMGSTDQPHNQHPGQVPPGISSAMQPSVPRIVGPMQPPRRPMRTSMQLTSRQALATPLSYSQPGAVGNVESVPPPSQPMQNLTQLTDDLTLATPSSSSQASTIFSLSSSSRPQYYATPLSSVTGGSGPRDGWQMPRSDPNQPPSSPLSGYPRAGGGLRRASQPDGSRSDISSRLSERQREKLPVYKMRQLEDRGPSGSP